MEKFFLILYAIAVMIRFFKENKLYSFLIIFVSVWIAFIYAYCCKECTFWGDDFFYARVYDNIDYLNCLKFVGHGEGYIGVFLCKFLSFGLPLLLNIHPYDFIGFSEGLFRGFFVALIILAVSGFVNLYVKSKKTYLITFIFLTIYFFLTFIVENSGFQDVIYRYYRYLFAQLFFALFWFYIFKNILNKEKQETSVYQLICICFCGFFIGGAVEIIYFVSALLAILLIVYNLFVKIISNLAKNNEFNLKNRFNLNINFYLPVFFLFLAISFSVMSSGFHSVAVEERGISSFIITKDILKDFLNTYYIMLIKEEFIYWILFIIIFFVSFCLAIKEKEYKKLIIPSLFMFAILAVMFSLIFCGKTFDEMTRDRFWLYHIHILLLYKFLLIYPFLIFISNIAEQIALNKKYIKWCYYLLIILIVTLIISYKSHIIYNFQENSLFLTREQKIQAYQVEKIIRYYTLNKETAKIPYFLTENGLESLREEIYHKPLQIKSDYKIYKDKNILKYGYIITNDSTFETFYKDGGTFTADEINDIKFSRLLDKNFVLNQKK